MLDGVLRRGAGVVHRGVRGTDGGVESVQVRVHWRVGAHGGTVQRDACHGRNGCHAVVDGRLESRCDAGDVLVMQLGQCPHEALREALLLVRHVLGTQKLGRSRRRGDQAVAGLDDEPLQLRRSQFEQPHVGGGEDVVGFGPQVAGWVGQIQRHVVFQSLLVVSKSSAVMLRKGAV